MDVTIVNREFICNLMAIGDAGVGKTSLTEHFLQKTFQRSSSVTSGCIKIMMLIISLLITTALAGDVDDVCISLRRESSAASSVINQGHPGRRGPVGPPGPKGDKGQTGQCNCNVMDNVLGLQEKLNSLNETVAVLMQTKQKTNLCYGGLLYNNTCIRLGYVRGRSGNYNHALETCNGSLADIASDEMFDVVYDYVRRTWIKDTGNQNRDFVELWFGSMYNHADNPGYQLTLTNGEKVTINMDRWHNGYPSSTRVNMGMRVNFHNTEQPMGLFNYQASWAGGIPLCQFQL